jgi:hypothetical protein
MNVGDEAAEVIQFWRSVEIFSPQPLPKVDAREHVADLWPGQPMPWEPGSYLSSEPVPTGKVWRHEVFGGVYELSRVRDALVKRFNNDDPGDQRKTIRDQSALFACTVDVDGFLMQNSALLSSCAWAVGRIPKAGRSTDTWLNGFKQDALGFGTDLAKLSGLRGEAIRLLASGMRDAVPEAVKGGVAAAVTTALAPATGPLAAAGGAMAGALAGSLAKATVGAGSKSSKEQPPGSDPASDRAGQPPPARLDLRALTGEEIQRFVSELADRLHVTQALVPRGVRVKSYLISVTRADDPPNQSFLNSFYADGLLQVSESIRRGNVGPGLAAYLMSSPSVDKSARIDVRRSPDAIRAGCAPERIRPGRWVTNVDRTLALGQQFAVNQIMERLADSRGIFAVNGPPGTGKTTMLRDVVAAIIVERAMRLAQLSTPGEGLAKGQAYSWATESFTHKIVPPRPNISGFEIVVSSANNGAVENVTMEIPGPGGIGTQWRDAASVLDYFTATAKLVCGDGAWAMIAAKLGNRANCDTFVESFWWDSRRDDRATQRERPSNKEARVPGQRRVPGDGMHDALRRLQTEAPEWQTARAAFRTALNRVRKLASERERAASAIEQLPLARDRHVYAAAKAQDAELAHTRVMSELPDADQRFSSADLRCQAARDRYRDHQQEKPGLIISLSTRFRAGRDWYAKHQELRQMYEARLRELEAAKQQIDEIGRNEATARQILESAQAESARLNQQIGAMQRLVGEARSRWGANVPSGLEHQAVDEQEQVERREKSAPWADEEFTRARTALFIAALGLHKAFIAAEAPTIRKNISALMDFLKGRGQPAPEATLAAWQTFFLVVPVVSSTFASIDRLFAGCGRESLGWLFIDEAGQATPQQAPGAIWRAQRTVVVGDPLQVEPVVTLPWDGQRALLHEFGVKEEWAPSRTSVQRIADRLAPYGTNLPARMPDGSDQVWVGTPLRVHRRCDHPMFDICNEIAYDGLMVYGTPDRDPFPDRDAWYDVASADADGNWIPAEGEALKKILIDLKNVGIAVNEIRVISPFKQVVQRALGIHRDVFPGPGITDGQLAKWVGTVHTMQGKEADVVVLVLGGSPDHPGARRWASDTPNLLNVAVSRARRRLYVVGDRKSWGSLPYFKVLAASLSVRQPSANG